MKKRIIFGSIMIVFVAGLLWLDWHLEQQPAPPGAGRPVIALPVTALLLLLTVVAFKELAGMAEAAGVAVLHTGGAAGSAALATLPFWWQPISLTGPGAAPVLLLLAIILLLLFAEQMIRSRAEDALRRIACTLLAVTYLGVGGALILGLRMRKGCGVEVLLLFLAAVKFADMGAYFTGKAFGRHKLIRWLSPAKTWEGLLGGLVIAAGLSVLIAWGLHIRLELWEAAVFGAVVGLAGQFADLCESLLKRSVKLKDSGSALPEFGGVLDILDSPLLAAPIAHILLALML